MRPSALAILLFFGSCNSSRIVTDHHQAVKTTEPSTVTISLLIEAAYNHCNLNDIISACGQVKSFRNFSVNYLSSEKMELRLVYDQISEGQKEELYNQVNILGAKVVSSSGL